MRTLQDFIDLAKQHGAATRVAIPVKNRDGQQLRDVMISLHVPDKGKPVFLVRPKPEQNLHKPPSEWGIAMKEVMAYRGLSMTALGRELGVQPSTVKKFLTGDFQQPGQERRTRFAKVLGVKA